MLYLVILGLMAVSFVLWREVAKLRSRVDDLEGASWSQAFVPATPVRRPDRPVAMRAPAVVIEQDAPQVDHVEQVAPLQVKPPVVSFADAPFEPTFADLPDDDVPEPRPRIGFE